VGGVGGGIRSLGRIGARGIEALGGIGAVGCQSEERNRGAGNSSGHCSPSGWDRVDRWKKKEKTIQDQSLRAGKK
jgi:hypothetical protein